MPGTAWSPCTPLTAGTKVRRESLMVGRWRRLSTNLYGFLQYLVGGPAVTRRLEIEYLQPVLLEVTYRLEAHLTSRDGRCLWVQATITDLKGQRVLSSTALFVLVEVDHFATAYARTRETITDTTAETSDPRGARRWSPNNQTLTSTGLPPTRRDADPNGCSDDPR